MATIADPWEFNSHKDEKTTGNKKAEYDIASDLPFLSRILTFFGNPQKREFLRQVSKLSDTEIAAILKGLPRDVINAAKNEIRKVDLLDPDVIRLKRLILASS